MEVGLWRWSAEEQYTVHVSRVGECLLWYLRGSCCLGYVGQKIVISRCVFLGDFVFRFSWSQVVLFLLVVAVVVQVFSLQNEVLASRGDLACLLEEDSFYSCHVLR